MTGNQFTELLTTTSISLAPGRLKADDNTDFNCAGSVTRVASNPSDFATPLALVINELVTNAVEHGLEGRTGTVWLLADRAAGDGNDEFLTVTIADDGVGLPDGQYTEGLGLQIVRTLVTSELGGSIQWSPRDGGGTAVEIVLNLARA